MVFTAQAPHNSPLLVVSSSLDPWHNLACEEYLLEALEPGQRILYLYRNHDAVVIGRHQNPWKESSPQVLERLGMPLVRRISGGGTVFHDPGNLNFSFIQDRSSFDKRGNHRLVQDALADLGIGSNLNERGDLLYEDRKFSGNALCYRSNGVVHHGTLLVQTDLNRLSAVLAGLNGAVETHAVPSKPAPVVNLADELSGLTVDSVRKCLERTFMATHNEARKIAADDLGGASRRQELAKMYRSWDWLYGKTPAFQATWSLPLNGHTETLSFQVRRGRVTGVTCSDTALQTTLTAMLVGDRFGGGALHSAVSESRDQADVRLEELSTWLLTQGL